MSSPPKASIEFYLNTDFDREVEIADDPIEPYRSGFRRDYARIIHSAAFRRLQGKTQLFPGDESDFFRNRLTHSLEVAQIAKSIAIRLNYQLSQNGYERASIDTDLVELAALAHDLGHPPFGHTGEAALDDCMKSFGGFEGNAQTLRILAKLEKRQTEPTGDDAVEFVEFQDRRDLRRGLNLCYRSLAATLKYDKRIPIHRDASASLSKGYYHTEADLVSRIKESVNRNGLEGEFKTVEMQIMDLADDIAYSTYDLEDALKAGFASPLDLLSKINDNEISISVTQKLFKSRNDREYNLFNPSEADKEIFEELRSRAAQVILDMLQDYLGRAVASLEEQYANADMSAADIWAIEAARADIVATLAVKLETISKSVANNGYVRTKFSSYLIGKRMKEINIEINELEPALSLVDVPENIRFEIDVLKHMTFELHVKSPRLRLLESRGKQVVKELFECFDGEHGGELLPIDWRQRLTALNDFPDKETHRKRLICDYIAGMTDAYALDMYSRLKSANPSVLFRPT